MCCSRAVRMIPMSVATLIWTVATLTVRTSHSLRQHEAILYEHEKRRCLLLVTGDLRSVFKTWQYSGLSSLQLLSESPLIEMGGKQPTQSRKSSCQGRHPDVLTSGSNYEVGRAAGCSLYLGASISQPRCLFCEFRVMAQTPDGTVRAMVASACPPVNSRRRGEGTNAYV